jgi:hypothetical protein
MFDKSIVIQSRKLKLMSKNFAQSGGFFFYVTAVGIPMHCSVVKRLK